MRGGERGRENERERGRVCSTPLNLRKEKYRYQQVKKSGLSFCNENRKQSAGSFMRERKSFLKKRGGRERERETGRNQLRKEPYQRTRNLRITMKDKPRKEIKEKAEGESRGGGGRQTQRGGGC